jgi:carbonic anhydrase/acetyltransferase-like protein (isoleucine patch superfamily)
MPARGVKAMAIYRIENTEPMIDPSVFVAPTATIIGNVTIGKNASVWFNTVIRGDSDAVAVGEASNIQDLSMLHVDPGKPVAIGNGVTIGHRCIVHGCIIEDHCLIGMGAIIMNGAVIGHGSIVAAGSVVLEETRIPPFSLVTGIPGKLKRTFDEAVLERIKNSERIYVERAGLYKSSFRTASAGPVPQ